MNRALSRETERLANLIEVHKATLDADAFRQAVETLAHESDGKSVRDAIVRLREHPEDQRGLLVWLKGWKLDFDRVRQAAEDVVLSALFTTAAGERVVPDAFWTTPMGALMADSRHGFPTVLLTATEAGLLLGTSRQYIHQLTHKGKLPSHSAGSQVIVFLSDLLDFVTLSDLNSV